MMTSLELSSELETLIRQWSRSPRIESACSLQEIMVATIEARDEEIAEERKRIIDADTPILEDMLDAWAYFSDYDVPIGMKERIERALEMRKKASLDSTNRNAGE